MKYVRTHNISILLIVLVLSLSSISFYNYHTQKTLLLEQMRSDAGDIVNSISSAMERFRDIKSTMNLQKLVNDMSLGLEIFEFRYIEPDGTIRNSMFQQEIGNTHNAASFQQTMLGDMPLGSFFYETRDYVKVMAIYYPIYSKEELIGIIDLSVDISEYELVDGIKPDFSLMRRQVDIMNLLKSIEGSIQNSLAIFEETDFYDFLNHYVKSAENIVQITVIDPAGKVLISSNNNLNGTQFSPEELRPPQLMELDGRPVYRMFTDSQSTIQGNEGRLMLLIDAAPYVSNERQLLRNALMSSAIAVLFALIIARAIYYSAIEQSRQEKERLEKLVKERTHEIELLSKTDSLTGLWNRCYLEEMMEMEFKRARRYRHDISLLVIDLDHFKRINDTYGHMAGDEVLRQASRRIQSCLRETDFVARYGGEEVVVLLPETTINKAESIGNKIRENLSATAILFEEETIHVTASIGISNLRSEHDSCQDVFAEADEALYTSKSEGRDRVTVYPKAV